MARPRHAASLSFWDALAFFPPPMVRLAARRKVAGKNVVCLSNQEIAIASGIPLSRVMQISVAESFDDVPIGEARRFCAACQFDPTRAADRERQRDYLRICQKKNYQRPPRYLTASPLWATQLLPVVQALRSTPISSSASRPSPSPAQRSAA